MDLDRIAKLLELLNDQKVAEFDYEDESLSLSVRLGSTVVQQVVAAAPAPVAMAAAPASAAPAVAEHDASLVDVPSPMVGTFYRAPSPESPAFVKLGDRVSAGQTLCIVEAMKLMNEIESEVDGVVTAILVENAQPVQFGQSLFKIKEG